MFSVSLSGPMNRTVLYCIFNFIFHVNNCMWKSLVLCLDQLLINALITLLNTAVMIEEAKVRMQPRNSGWETIGSSIKFYSILTGSVFLLQSDMILYVVRLHKCLDLNKTNDSISWLIYSCVYAAVKDLTKTGIICWPYVVYPILQKSNRTKLWSHDILYPKDQLHCKTFSGHYLNAP